MSIENILLFLGTFIAIITFFTRNRNKFLDTSLNLVLGLLICSIEIYRIIHFGLVPFYKVFDIILIIVILLITKNILIKINSIKYSNLLHAFIVLLLLVAIFLPSKYKQPSHLPPILNSIFFYIHVPLYIISYFSLFSASIGSLIYLMKRNIPDWLKKSINIDTIMSFYLMNLGLISGAIWADNTWGSFWSWDPKENISLAIVLLLSIYFHTKSEKSKSIIIILSTMLVFFNFLLLNFIVKGLHSY
ncbi:MAG: cytochrome c biogenesis protein CcsA [Candidatus Marinimicrobia bacterium]|nr:cytochrome c biogenesis protein CcsA [Candidatus Neomarinimicrobiota bacterium]